MIMRKDSNLKGPRRFLSRAENLEDPMHAHELENCTDLFRHPA
jgi:hypothetical protein